MTDRDTILRRRALFVSSALAAVAGCGGTTPTPEQSSSAPAQSDYARAPVTAHTRVDAADGDDAGSPADAADAWSPDARAVVRVCLSIIIPPKIEFAFGATAPNSAARAVIDAAAKALADHPDICIEIQGHSQTGEPRTQALSEKRAEAIKRELIQLGVFESRLSTVGFGATRPLSATGKENRRVEFRAFRDDKGCPPLSKGDL